MSAASPSRQPGPPYPSHVPLLKGALIALDESSGSSTTVPFQYNPGTVRRRLRPNQLGASESDRSTAIRFTGAAVEVLSLEARLEAVDLQVTGASATAVAYGLYPLLAALQLFAYPSTSQVATYQSGLDAGSVDIVPPLGPRLVFVWGPHRVLPVRLIGLEIVEELFDPNLNPIIATVGLELRVLTYSDVTPQSGDYSLFLAHQSNLESLAERVPQGQAGRLTGVNVSNPQESI